MTPGPTPPSRRVDHAHAAGALRSAARTTWLTPRGKTALFALGAVGALVFSMVWNPPTASVHSFTEASDYNPDKESGCTNSGEGCHGDESDYRDFNAYHPEAKCTTCHEYQGVGCIPCHAPREHECALCHDGSMKRAPDRVRITDPYPRGHYRETTHTATATDMRRRVRAAANGDAAASCSACHSKDLATAHEKVPVVDGSTYGADIGCGECHNDLRSFGQAEVLSDWKARTCEACHKVGSSSPMHDPAIADPVDADKDFGCAGSGEGCHASTDLHALHADAPKDCSGRAATGEPTCHDLGAESHAPTARTCGGTDGDACHRSSDPSGYRHEATFTKHAPTTGGPAADSSFSATPCGECHFLEPDGRSLLTEHQRPTSEGSGAGMQGCVACHEHDASAETISDDWSTRDTAATCSTCHDGVNLEAAHTEVPRDAHDASASEGCAGSGPGCHPATDIAAVGNGPDAIHRDCVRCHDKTPSNGSIAYSPGSTGCGSGRDCHAAPGEYDPATAIHDGATRVDGADGAHDAGTGFSAGRVVDEASGTSTRCPVCHSRMLGTEHGRPSASLAGADECRSCHNANVASARTVKRDWADRDDVGCGSCHGARGGSDAAHGAIDTVHVATQKDHDGAITQGYCSRVGCHGTADVRTLHAEKGCTPAACHQPTGDIRGAGIMTCGGHDGDERSCHTGYSAHPDFMRSHVATEIAYDGTVGPGGCVAGGCHPSADVTVLHRETDGFCYQAGCHAADGPERMTCGGNDPDIACHTSGKHLEFYSKHQATEIAYDGTVGPGGCAVPGCHPSADVTVVHEHRCAIAGCHVEGGPDGRMTCGGSDPATACHVTGKHLEFYAKHQAVERGTDGSASPGACVRSGCHTSVDATTVHHHECYLAGCHVAGGPTVQTCGGAEGQIDTCHVGYTESQHFQSHDAALTGTVDGVTYSHGENEGCLGTCHAEDLVDEHRVRMIGGGLEGGVTSVCAICHAAKDAGPYAASAAVAAAVGGHDRRCVSCHSGAADGAGSVAAPPATCVPTPALIAPSIEDASTPSARAATAHPSAAHSPFSRRRIPAPRAKAHVHNRAPLPFLRRQTPKKEPPASQPSTSTHQQAVHDGPGFKTRHVDSSSPQGRDLR